MKKDKELTNTYTFDVFLEHVPEFKEGKVDKNVEEEKKLKDKEKIKNEKK